METLLRADAHKVSSSQGLVPADAGGQAGIRE